MREFVPLFVHGTAASGRPALDPFDTPSSPHCWRRRDGGICAAESDSRRHPVPPAFPRGDGGGGGGRGGFPTCRGSDARDRGRSNGAGAAARGNDEDARFPFRPRVRPRVVPGRGVRHDRATGRERRADRLQRYGLRVRPDGHGQDVHDGHPEPCRGQGRGHRPARARPRVRLRAEPHRCRHHREDLVSSNLSRDDSGPPQAVGGRDAGRELADSREPIRGLLRRGSARIPRSLVRRSGGARQLWHREPRDRGHADEQHVIPQSHRPERHHRAARYERGTRERPRAGRGNVHVTHPARQAPARRSRGLGARAAHDEQGLAPLRSQGDQHVALGARQCYRGPRRARRAAHPVSRLQAYAAAAGLARRQRRDGARRDGRALAGEPFRNAFDPPVWVALPERRDEPRPARGGERALRSSPRPNAASRSSCPTPSPSARSSSPRAPPPRRCRWTTQSSVQR